MSAAPRARRAAISGSFFFVPVEPERRRVGADRGVVEQTLVDVADLLDAERAEAERAALAPAGHVDLERLERVEDVEDGAVRDARE